jgi:poly(A) polymerase
LESDLRGRDFTINSIASHLSKPNELLDPLGGVSDIKNKIIRICSKESFKNDPVRILRAIRLAAGLEFKIDPDSRELMNQAAHLLVDVSQERVRDELFRIFDGPEPAKAILALDIINATPYILPELKFFKNVTLPPPHTKELWFHTLDTLKYLELMFIYFNQSQVIIDPKKIDDPIFNGFSDPFASIGRKLNHFWGEISDYLMRSLVSPRSIRSLLFFSAMYHDAAKADPQRFDGQEGYSSSDHGVVGSNLAAKRASALKLSNAEIDRIKKTVRRHMEPTYMARLDRELTSLEIYRYFREVGEVGIDICLLSLADLLATYGSTIPDERLERQLLVVHQLFDAWWNCPEKKIKPMSIVTGSDLISEFYLQPGPLVGLYLEKIREEQVQGTVKTRKEALNFIKSIIDGSNHE